MLMAIDREMDGAGFVRNQLLAHVDTPYVVFLDADDWLEPNFIEECLNVIQPGRYVYTDWYQGKERINAPQKAWCNGTWHVISTMVHTQDARNVGGFDTTLPALEDTDFWLKMVTRRICGLRIAKPLSHYGKEGQRAKRVHEDGSVLKIKNTIMQRYQGAMGCCGDNPGIDISIPVGQKQQGDVLARALWRGNRQEHGRMTGRRYPRMAFPEVTWASPYDIRQSPELWQQVIEPAITDKPRNGSGLDGFVEVMRDNGLLGQEPPPPIIAKLGDYEPDIENVVRIANGLLE
jgi:hypothetical protein